jgi:hypothetical protein
MMQEKLDAWPRGWRESGGKCRGSGLLSKHMRKWKVVKEARKTEKAEANYGIENTRLRI